MKKMKFAAAFVPLLSTCFGGSESAVPAIFAATDSGQQQSVAIYMATDGLDTNAGTIESPVATVQKALALAERQPTPAEIVVRGGTYFLQAPVVIRRSNSASPLLIRSADNETAIFDGSVRIERAEPVEGSSGVYAVKGDFPNDAPPAVWEAATGRHFKKLAGLDSVRLVDCSAVVLDGQTMAIRCHDGISPLQTDIRISPREIPCGIHVLRDNVTLKGLEFRNFISGGTSTAVRIGPNLAGSGKDRQGVFTTNAVIDSCRTWNCYFGFHVVGAAETHFTRNRIRNSVTGIWISGVDTLVEHCEMINDAEYQVPWAGTTAQSGIRFYNKPEDAVIRNNLIKNFRGGITSKGSPGTYIIENNTVIGSGLALQIDLGFKVRHNVFSGFGSAFSQDYKMGKDAAVDGNVFWGPRGLATAIKDPAWGCGDNNVYGDPLFAAPHMDDYRLLPESPALRIAGGKIAGAFPQVPPDYAPAPKLRATAGPRQTQQTGVEPPRRPVARVPAPPRIMYVGNDGIDAEEAGSRDKPFRTLQFALDRAMPGDRVRITPGVYFGANRIEASTGTPERPLIIEGLYPNTAILDGLDEVGTLLRIDNVPHVIVRNLDFRWYAGQGIVIMNSRGARVTGCRFQNQYWRGGADVEGRPALFFSNCPEFMADHCVFTRTRYQLEFNDSPGGQVLHNTFIAGAVTHIMWRGSPTDNITIKYNSINWNGNQMVNISQPLDLLRNRCVLDFNNYGTTFQKAEGTAAASGTFGKSLPKPFPYLPSNREFIVFQDTTDPAEPTSRTLVNMADWQEFSGQDKNSIFADPKWIDPLAGRFDVAADSPNLLPDGKIIGALGYLGEHPNMVPEVVVTTPPCGEPIRGPFTVSADASDFDGAVKKVEFYVGDRLLGEATSPPYRVTGASLPPGRYVVTARATDDRGGTAISDEVSITVAEP